MLERRKKMQPPTQHNHKHRERSAQEGWKNMEQRRSGRRKLAPGNMILTSARGARELFLSTALVMLLLAQVQLLLARATHHHARDSTPKIPKVIINLGKVVLFVVWL
uniref:Uncharacterized protein n=1 Tax=Anopheles culicifacies TaxID=139723 RepID=A0A182M559_9DIPT